MAQEEYNAVYIGSNDYWGYDADTFNEETNFFGKAWVVPENEATPELINEDNLSRCQLYYELGKTDNHLFTPDSILYDSDAQFLIVRGNQGRIGQPNIFVEKNRIYAVNEMAQRYKNMTDGPDSRAPGRFTVNYIVADNEADKEEIKAFMEGLDEEVVVEAGAESYSAHGCGCGMQGCGDCNSVCGCACMCAESYDAENLNRINPVYVEGAEDIFGSESLNSSDNVSYDMEDVVIPSASDVDLEDANLVGIVGGGQDFGQYDSEELADPEVFGEFVNDNVVGQDYAGQVIGQNAEGLADPEVYGEYVNDNVVGQDYAGQVIGQNAEDIFHVVLHAEEGAMEVHTTNGGVFLADIDTGAILHDVNNGFAAEDAEPLNAEDVGFLLSLSGEGKGVYKFETHDATGQHYSPESYKPGENPENYTPPSDNYSADNVIETIGGTPSSPMNGVDQNYGTGVEVYVEDAENIVEAFQEFPLINEFNLSGWVASAAVIGVAALSGAYLSRRA